MASPRFKMDCTYFYNKLDQIIKAEKYELYLNNYQWVMLTIDDYVLLISEYSTDLEFYKNIIE